MGVQIPHGKGQFLGEEEPVVSIGTFCRELCRNSWTNRFAIWIVDSGGPKEARVQSYSPGGANVPTWEGTLTPPDEYDWTVHLRRRCGLRSNYFDHLLVVLVVWNFDIFLVNFQFCVDRVICWPMLPISIDQWPRLNWKCSTTTDTSLLIFFSDFIINLYGHITQCGVSG